MTLTELSGLSAGVLAYSWNLHLKIKGINFWSHHQMLDKVYHDAIETTDRICESALEHNENCYPTAASNDDSLSIDELIMFIDMFVNAMKTMIGQYDAGVDNMLGDECERWSKWCNYFLRNIIDGSSSTPS